MANTKDLRYIKTEKLIVETYKRLYKNSGRGVKVSELCDEAMINKTTFYAHYETIDALHRHICEAEVDAILDECGLNQSSLSDARLLVTKVIHCAMSHSDTLEPLFQDDIQLLTSCFENSLKKRLLFDVSSEEMKMKITFAIGGAVRLMAGERSPERIRMMTFLIGRTLAD